MILRNLTNDDAEYIISAWSTSHRMLGYGIPDSREKLIQLINEWNTKIIDGKYYEMFAIIQEGTILGLLSLYEIDSKTISIGISIDQAYWRKRYASEALEIAFQILREKELYHIVSNCRSDNIASILLHKKCGFLFLYEDISKRSGGKIYRYEKYLDKLVN